jgi:hypothetical protein
MEEMRNKCYGCAYRAEIPGNAHSRCHNKEAVVAGDAHGIKNGWFVWPYNFDPTWLIECDGWAEAGTVRVEMTADPLGDFVSLMGRRMS